MTARVFVPLVGADGSAEQMFEAIASDAAPESHPAQLIPQISELYDFGLYRIGQSVREAVTRFIESRRQRVWLGRRNARLAPWYLRISDLQIGRLSDGNARSAGLGLTLATLLHIFEKDHRLVFATGEVVLQTGPDAPTVAIGAVDGLRGKLMLVGDYIVQHHAALGGKRIAVVLPAKTVDGRDVRTAEAVMLKRLTDAATDAGATLDIACVDTLDALEPIFGHFEMREIITRGRAALLGSAAMLAGLAVSGWLMLAHAPITLRWVALDVDTASARGIQTQAVPDAHWPRRARYDTAADRLNLLPPCYDDQRQPLFVGGETLVLRIAVEDGLPLASRVRPPRIFIASVSRSADPVILDGELFRRTGQLADGASPLDAVTAIPIEPVEDEVRLFVVATRDPRIEASQLLADLRERLKGLSGPAVLAATASFLQDRTSAEIDYQFRVTNDAGLCAS